MQPIKNLMQGPISLITQPCAKQELKQLHTVSSHRISWPTANSYFEIILLSFQKSFCCQNLLYSSLGEGKRITSSSYIQLAQSTAILSAWPIVSTSYSTLRNTGMNDIITPSHPALSKCTSSLGFLAQIQNFSFPI